MKNTYKILFSCILILLQLQLTAQDKPTIYLGGGLNFPDSKSEVSGYLNRDAGFQLGGYVPLMSKKKVSWGLNIAGDYFSSSHNSFKNSPAGFPIAGQTNNDVVLNNENDLKQRLLKVGAGPQFNFNISDKFRISPVLHAGVASINQNPISFSQTTQEAKDTQKEIFAQDEVSSTQFFFSPRIRMSYPVFKKLGIWAETNYTMTQASQNRRVLVPANPPRDGNVYSVGDIIEGSYREESNNNTLNTLGVNFGLSYSFGKDKPRKIVESPIKAPKESLASIKKQNQLKPGVVQFDNPAKKDKQNIRKLIAVSPKNNTAFEDAKNIKAFTWQLLGNSIKPAAYIIEVKRLGGRGQVQRTFTARTDKTTINAATIFKDDKIESGQYEWKVTESTSGISSTPSFFNVSNCQIEFTISKDSIECLGYEGENRKFKISFESTYSSSSGDLTYANIGSGLTVYDQSYNALSYTLVSPNPTLVTQIGASSTTVIYSFEVIAPSSVTAIGFGLQGDDLDPSPILCQPGVSLIIDELPDCLCNECEDMELTFNNFSISPTGGAGNQFSFNGNINVNVPVYAMEFQVQSYSYTATPSPCTNGVSSIEESGMILMPGTTINGSSALQLFNESVSGSSSSNNNATKIIKYTSTSALNGAIPVNLNIGLPGPLAGLDANCCKINYTVCIKVRVFYDEGKCKSCVFTHCFEFSNQ